MARVTMNSRFVGDVVRMIDARMGKIAAELRDEVEQELSTPYPPASKPGEPPHVRTGGLRAAVFYSRVKPADYVVGFRRVSRDPDRPNSDRSLLAIWTELGTGVHRQPFPAGSNSTMAKKPADTATTGSRSSMEPRPVLIPVLMRNRQRIMENLTRGGVGRLG